jgi:formylglycine-generating enzyme
MYFRSFDRAGLGTASFPAKISQFHLDKYEVTVGRFRAFVEAGKGTQENPPSPGTGAHANILGSGWKLDWNANLPTNTNTLRDALMCNARAQKWTDAPGANESLPMNCLTWFQAAAFCAWDGGRLPTEAEWNYAAAGGDEQRVYPWSSPSSSTAIDGAYANYASSDLIEVGAKPAGNGRWSHSDMAGNVAEWTLDFQSSYQDNCSDCARVAPAPGMPPNRMFRGGAYYYLPNAETPGRDGLRTGAREAGDPSRASDTSGVRCARP